MVSPVGGRPLGSRMVPVITAPRERRIEAVARSPSASAIERPGRPGAFAPNDVLTQPGLVALTEGPPAGRFVALKRPASSVITVRPKTGSAQLTITDTRRTGREGCVSDITVPVIAAVPATAGADAARSRTWACTVDAASSTSARARAALTALPRAFSDPG